MTSAHDVDDDEAPSVTRARARSERDKTWLADPDYPGLSSVEQARMEADDPAGIFWGGVGGGVALALAGGYCLWHGATKPPNRAKWLGSGSVLVVVGGVVVRRFWG